MDKLLTYSGYDQNGPHIFSLDDDPNRVIGHVKMAREVRALPPAIEQHVRSARPIRGKTQLLIDALGTSEYWGSNVNGDWFPEKALAHEGDDYGYRTFMRYGHPFKHHVNKDPTRAYGDRVTLSAYDPGMHRVLLIVSVHNDKCFDILNDLANNKFWDVSMGCRVPWDECSICKNRARNRAEYCNDLRYQMNKILPDGRRVCAYNWLPKFFDISFVLIGAEKASHVLQKVAHGGLPYEIKSSAEEWNLHLAKFSGLKIGATNKSAVMSKRVPSNGDTTVTPLNDEKKMIVKRLLDDSSVVKGREKELSLRTQENLTRYPLKEVFATLASLGIILRPEEFQRLVLIKTGHRELAKKLASRRLVFDEYSPGKLPSWARDFGTFRSGEMNEKIALAMRPYMTERSVYPEVLAARLARFEKEAEDVAYERNSPWFPMTEEQLRDSSGFSGTVPASLALASAYIAYKNVLPSLLGSGSMAQALKRSWFIPILVGAGVGASVGISTMLGNGGTAKLSSVDAIDRAQYHTQKTAASNATLMRMGVPAAIYAYAGIRRKQALQGRRLSALDRAVVLNPGWAALVGFGLTPSVLRSIKTLSKHAGIGGDLGLYALGSPGRFMPGILAAGLLDSLIFRGIARLASKGKRKP